MTLLSLFSIGFIMGLTGAMAPGPLLTVTITESTRRGGIAGPMIVLGHGILEITLVSFIVFGLGKALNNEAIFAIIALAGGLILIYMGYGTVKGLKTYQISGKVESEDAGLHPVISGIIVSLSNPYWFIWWITIGMGYVIFARELGIYGVVFFFLGHILSDLLWYSFISYGIHFGGRFFSIKIIKVILFICSLFMMLFGLFFILKGLQFILPSTQIFLSK